jgi:PAS domain S-box-containing protein
MSTKGATKILAVDNLPENLLVYEVVLDELQLDMIKALSGEQALEQVQQHEFAVILLDVNMPGLDGFETAALIRQQPGSALTPIIFLTAYIDEMRSNQGYSQGAVDFMQTPVVPEILRAKVKVFVDLFRMREEVKRQRDAEVLRESEERIRLIVDAALDAVVAIDGRGIITGWNPQAETIFGWTRDEVLGRELADLVIPERFRAAHRRGLAQFLETGEGPILNRRLELSAVRKGGEEFPVELTISPLSIAGRPEFSAFIRDIRDRKASEEQIRRYASELERSNRELDRFAYSASHDLRAPLRAIDQMAHWLIEDYSAQLPEEARRDLNLMQQRVQRMDRLLEDLLQYSRAGRADGKTGRVASRGLVAEVVDLLAPPEGFTVSIGEMPDLCTQRAPLEQVLRNLIGNAIKHHDRRDGRVEVWGREDGDGFEFSVRDDGPGIAAKYHDQVFQMFTTLKSRDVVEGSGMGLPLVKKILESRGGSIRLESEEGRGATFRFTWPKSTEVE